MTLHSRFHRSLFAVVFAACVGLFLAGCDSNGTSEQENEPPSADISLDSRSGLTAAFSAAGSTDPDGEITSYEWEFGDGSTDTGETVLQEYGAGNTYSATVTVTDDEGATSSAEMDVMVSETPTSFDVTIEAVDAPAEGLIKSGIFEGAVNEQDPEGRPLQPGETFKLSFTAGSNVVPSSGMKLSFLSMFGQSNDAFYAFEPGGIDLFQDDAENDRQDPMPIGLEQPEDVTDRVALWDAGTEADQEPGFGDQQAPRQDSRDSGEEQGGVVNLMEDIDGDGDPENDKNGNGTLDTDANGEYEFPAVSDAMEITVDSRVIQQTGSENSGVYEFTVTIENVSDETNTVLTSESSDEERPVAISPGVFAAHIDQNPVSGDDVLFFAPDGTAESEFPIEGLEEQAEDANASVRAEAITPITGVLVPFSPGAYAVHGDEVSFHNVGGSASDGIRMIGEDGNPGTMESMLSGSDGVKSTGTFGSGPTPPGMSQSFTVEGIPGDRLSLATMFIQSNDFYFAFEPSGVPLFTNDAARNGGLTQRVHVYDAGTEPEEESGIGRTQAPRQPASGDLGPDEGDDIARVGDPDNDGLLEEDGFEYDPSHEVIEVTITPQN